MSLSSLFGEAALLRRIGIEDGKAFMAVCIERGWVHKGPRYMTDSELDLLIKEGKKREALAKYHARKLEVAHVAPVPPMAVSVQPRREQAAC